eukprot:5783560-Pleurochrysis_carterae.AAC.2
MIVLLLIRQLRCSPPGFQFAPPSSSLATRRVGDSFLRQGCSPAPAATLYVTRARLVTCKSIMLMGKWDALVKNRRGESVSVSRCAYKLRGGMLLCQIRSALGCSQHGIGLGKTRAKDEVLRHYHGRYPNGQETGTGYPTGLRKPYTKTMSQTCLYRHSLNLSLVAHTGSATGSDYSLDAPVQQLCARFHQICRTMLVR